MAEKIIVQGGQDFFLFYGVVLKMGYEISKKEHLKIHVNNGKDEAKHITLNKHLNAGFSNN